MITQGKKDFPTRRQLHNLMKKGFLSAWLILVLMLSQKPALADDMLDSGTPNRQTTITIPYTRYTWWIARWLDNELLCTLVTNHEGLPTGDEIYTSCGKTIYNLWASTPACTANNQEEFSTTQCSGLYLHLANFEPAEKETVVDIPPPQVWVTLTNCSQGVAENHCLELPYIELTGEEPLPNEKIININAIYDGVQYNCNGETCLIPLSPTLLSGTTMEFWADSSFGDSSEHFTALLRVIDSGVAADPKEKGWYVDILSSQWKGNRVASCAQIWDAFPPIEGLPSWLSTPSIPELMASGETYFYLAGRLIEQKLVDASDCPSAGLLPNRYANACGMEKALPLVEEWQNKFDEQIIQIANQTGVPAQLMKNIFAQESQFWPGTFKDPKEFGLGQLTDNGAETILLWNPAFFKQFCPLMLSQETCGRGYVFLTKENQSLLRGALAKRAKVDCPDCQDGLETDHINFSINLFAQILQANCSQVSRMVYNATGRSPGSLLDYESLWKLTIANYHAGPGCMSYPLYQAWAKRDFNDWDAITYYLTPACQGVIYYVDKVTR
jgi:hypothetical protein